jgi:hypothetical protein
MASRMVVESTRDGDKLYRIVDRSSTRTLQKSSSLT